MAVNLLSRRTLVDMPTDFDGLAPASIASRLTGPLFTPERYHFHPHLDSTNRHALDLARAGAPEGTVVVADAQSQGRGRLGRVWSSPPGENLYVTLIMRPEILVAHAPRLTLVAGLATLDAVREAGVTEARLKWPNDILVQGRKLAGILTEMATEGDRVRHVVIGVGVNVNGRAERFPPEVAARAVTMADILQNSIERGIVLARLLSAWEAWYRLFLSEGFAPVRLAWRERALLTGQKGRIDTAQGTRWVELLDLDEEGFLLACDREGGEPFRVLAGDVLLTGWD
ncbi:Bifunctional ligase/repressor BirA [Candidatus Magnetaquicoccaceae bacterium FCR-1]|uniref:Bifunctional ligase/repressor BirA n=1 Tax=Candidatus Magnetaquiglobus chichijimensis TaxID=3141448 RepID=A0ABQ0CC37_9PROT